MFESLKIVELASVLAGPLVGSFFAELGAKVTKVENKTTGGDVTRKWKLPIEAKNTKVSAYYAAANYGKKVILLDFTDSKDYQKALKFIEEADIVIANFKQGDAQKLNLDYKTLSKINTTLIYAELSGFGDDDLRPAFDVVLQAEAGYMFMNGEKNAKPLKMPVALMDILAAHQLKEGILCALIQKMQTGKGSKVNVSLYDAALSALANQATNWLMAGEIPQAIGSQHPNIAPYGDLFQTIDKKWIVLAIGSEKQFQDFIKLLGINHLLEDERFKNNQERVVNREILNEYLEEAISKKQSADLAKNFNSENIPFGLVKNMQEVFLDPKAQAMIIKDIIKKSPAKRVKNVGFSIDSN